MPQKDVGGVGVAKGPGGMGMSESGAPTANVVDEPPSPIQNS